MTNGSLRRKQYPYNNSIALLILNLRARWRWVVNVTSRTLYPRERTQGHVYLVQGVKIWADVKVDSKTYTSYDFSRFAGSPNMTHHTSSVDMIPVLRSWAPTLASEGRRKNPASTNLPRSALPCPGDTLRWLVVRTSPNGPELARVEFYRDAAASIHSVGLLVGISDVCAKRVAVAARAIRVFSHTETEHRACSLMCDRGGRGRANRCTCC